MATNAFVPSDFEVPTELIGADFRLTPLLPEHNDADYEAWTSSMEHIHATPGFEERPWPEPMPREQNLRDLEGHAQDFRERTGFAYTVRDVHDATIGCVYIYPAEPGAEAEADVRSWVRADHAQLDLPVYDAVSEWLRTSWPFEHVAYAPRTVTSR